MNYVPNFNFFGVPAAQAACITGHGAPTVVTEGIAGCLYLDMDTGDVYKCGGGSADGYVWVPLCDNDGTAGYIVQISDDGDGNWTTSSDFTSAMDHFLNVGDITVLICPTPDDYCYVTRIEVGDMYDYMILHSGAGIFKWNQDGSIEKIAEPESGGSAEGAVLYNAPQELTDEQKAQARVNTESVGTRDIFEAKPSSNLLDMDAVSYGTFIDVSGKEYTGGSYSNYNTTDYIPCKPGDTLRLQYVYGTVRYDSSENTYFKFPYVFGFDKNKSGVSSAKATSVQTYLVPDGVAYVRIAFLPNNFVQFSDIAILIQDDATVIPYEPYGLTLLPTLKPEIVPPAETPAPIAFLPDEICVAVGRTIEIYNNQVCPLADKYHFRWVCNVGKALKRKFSITGTDGLVGNYDLTLEIYDDAEKVVYAKTATLKIVSAVLNTEVSICPIGDSLTNGKYWLNEVRTLSADKISFVGTRGTVEGRKHEGRSGFTAGSYLKATSYTYENEGVHPFWDAANSCFSWEYYKANSGINPTAVQIFLGTNDLFGGATAETFTANIKAMVDSIRANDTNIPIFVVLTILTGNQNGIGVQQSSDGFASYKGKHKYALDCHYIKALQTLYNALKSYAGLYFVPLAECHDNEYNFGAVETAVNPRASQKEYMPTEGVHPQQQGYEQMADIMYSVICAKLG